MGQRSWLLVIGLTFGALIGRQIHTTKPALYFNLWPDRSLSVTTPVAFHGYQRSLVTGLVTVSAGGSYTGESPTHVEYSFAGSPWVGISSERVSGGNWSGAISLPTGQGTLSFRYSNETSLVTSVSMITVGDAFIIGGDSIAAGRLRNNQKTVPNRHGIKAVAYVPTLGWQLCDDPTVAGGSGSFWPIVGTQLVAATSTVPVIFINTGIGSTGLTYPSTGAPAWPKGNTGYTAMQTAIANAGLANPPRAFLFHLGANDAADPDGTISQTEYQVALTRLVSDRRADYPNATVFFAQLGEVLTGSPPDRGAAIDNIREAQRQVWDTVNGAASGPVLYDIVTDDGVHYTGDAKAAMIATRWSLAIAERFYGGADARRSPVVTSFSTDPGTNQPTDRLRR